MAWGEPRSFPRAILHIDGDAFFAACEVAKNPKLRGKPVVTGKERGIVSAATYEAKRRGVRRGVPLSEVRKICPDAIILPSDYETYSLFSERMYAIVRRYTPMLEEYSIDECFADLTGLRRTLRMSYPHMVEKIKHDLERELDISFSMGLSATKVLAKIGSKWQKPAGLTMIPLGDAKKFLEKTPTKSVWGIGPNTAAYLLKFGIRTAFDFAQKPESWVQEVCVKPIVGIWKELNGQVTSEIETEGRESYQSISKTKTFTPPSTDQAFIFSQLSKNIENACIKARRWGLSTPEVFFFLKTQDFKYHSVEVKLSHATCVPQDILRVVSEYFPRLFSAGGGSASGRRPPLYRATGITLMKLQDSAATQLDLFGSVLQSKGVQRVFENVDQICKRYGKHTIFLASSFHAMTPKDSKPTYRQAHARAELPERRRNLLPGETERRRLGLAFLGEVS